MLGLLHLMNKETLVLLVMPPILIAVPVTVHVVLVPISLTGIWVFVALAFVASLGCLVRAVTLLKAGRPHGYVCGAAAILYIVLLVILCTPAKTKQAANQTAQPTGASRLAQRQIERQRRLAPVADLCVSRTLTSSHLCSSPLHSQSRDTTSLTTKVWFVASLFVPQPSPKALSAD